MIIFLSVKFPGQDIPDPTVVFEVGTGEIVTYHLMHLFFRSNYLSYWVM